MKRSRLTSDEHCVAFHHKLFRAPSNPNAFKVDPIGLEGAINWCRAASYRCTFDFKQPGSITETVFRFSDPNVAFEFKMRFGGGA